MAFFLTYQAWEKATSVTVKISDCIFLFLISEFVNLNLILEFRLFLPLRILTPHHCIFVIICY